MIEGPDKSQFWLIAVATLVINLIISGIFRAQGLLFVEFIDQFEVDRKLAALPFFIRSAVQNLAVPAVGILGQKYGFLIITIMGGILGSLSSVLCSFTSDIVWITIIWGGMNGFALAMIGVLPQNVFSHYNFKNRSKFSVLVLSGCPFSAFIFPAILEILLKTYGIHGTFLIVAGFFLNIIPVSILLKEPPWYEAIDIENPKVSEPKNEITANECTNNRKYRKSSTVQKKKDCGIQVEADKLTDFENDKKLLQNIECKHHPPPFKRSHSHGSLMVQAHLNNMQLSTMFPRVSSIELNCRTFNKNPESIYDVDMDYLIRQSDLMFHMLSMEIPNVETSYRAILLEVEQDDLWHPEKNEIVKEIENIYCLIEKSIEIDEISIKSGRPNGPYLKKTFLNGGLSLNEKSGSLRAVKRYLKTYKERGLQQLGKIRSAPNMSNIYNEIAIKDYVMTKLRELCNGNEIRIISQLCEYNPKDVLRVLFQLRTLYSMYNKLECCDKCEGGDISESFVETGDISSYRKESFNGIDFIAKENIQKRESTLVSTFNFQTQTPLKLHITFIFLLLLCTRIVICLTIVSMYITIVDFGLDKDFEIEEGKFIIGAHSLGDLVGRLCFGWICGKGYVPHSQYTFVCMVLQGAALICIPLLYSKWMLLICFSLCGLSQGFLYFRQPVLVEKYLTQQEQSIAVRCMDFFSGILILFLPIYIGFIRDSIGSYDLMYYINGAVALIIGCVWFFERGFVHRPDKEAEI